MSLVASHLRDACARTILLLPPRVPLDWAADCFTIAFEPPPPSPGCHADPPPLLPQRPYAKPPPTASIVPRPRDPPTAGSRCRHCFDPPSRHRALKPLSYSHLPNRLQGIAELPLWCHLHPTLELLQLASPQIHHACAATTARSTPNCCPNRRTSLPRRPALIPSRGWSPNSSPAPAPARPDAPVPPDVFRSPRLTRLTCLWPRPLRPVPEASRLRVRQTPLLVDCHSPRPSRTSRHEPLLPRAQVASATGHIGLAVSRALRQGRLCSGPSWHYTVSQNPSYRCGFDESPLLTRPLPANCCCSLPGL